MATDDGFELGPFTGGLNQLEDPRLIADSQLAICRNMDIGRAGELTIRNGLKLIQARATQSILLGTALLSNNTSRAFIRDPTDVTVNTLYYKDGASITDGTVAWTSLATAAAGSTEKVVQYNNSAWFIPKGSGVSGVRQTLDTNTVSTVAAMPRGSGAVIFKDRLFIFGPVDTTNTVTQRVFYSAATDFTSWPAANFFDINPGDGEGVTAAIAASDTLIFFKRHSTWALFFDTDPGLGVLRKVNSEIGATGPDSVVSYENVLYLTDERTVYRVQSLLFTDIGKNLNLKTERTTITFTPTTQDFVVTLGTRILFCVYNGSTYEYYVYNVEIDAWTEYTFTEQPSKFHSIIAATGFRDFIATKNGSPNVYVISPFKTDDASFGDYPQNVTPVAIVTKSYGGGPSSRFKRLFWWGMEISTNGSILMTATAVNGTTSPAANLTGDGTFKFFKAFSPQRFRYIQFRLNSSSANLRLTILPGLAYLGRNKNEVGNAVNA